MKFSYIIDSMLHQFQGRPDFQETPTFQAFMASMLPKYIPNPMAQTVLTIEILALIITLLHEEYEKTHHWYTIAAFHTLHTIAALNLLFFSFIHKSGCH